MMNQSKFRMRLFHGLPITAIAALVIALSARAQAQGATESYRITGPNSGGAFGWSISSAADLDGDGLTDFIVGARDKGVVYGIRGIDGAILWSYSAGGEFGNSVDLIGDLDGDGRSDFCAGNPLASGKNGEVYVVSTQTLSALHVLTPSTSAGRFGGAVAAMGDVNGDAVPDFAVEADMDSNPGVGTWNGRFRVISGASYSTIWEQDGSTGYDHFGRMSVSLRDIDGDGALDAVCGSCPTDPYGMGLGPGYLQIRNGSNGQLLHQVVGTNNGDFFGIQSAVLSDITGDGIWDLAVSAAGSDAYGTDRGLVRVFSGATGSTFLDISPPAYCTHALSFGGDGTESGVITELPDLDHDGFPDIAIGMVRASNPNLPGSPETGAVGIFSGHTGSLLQTLWGEHDGDMFGWSVRLHRGLSHPWSSSLVVGSRLFDSNRGAVYVFDLTHDCNGNSIEDSADIQAGTSQDCNGNLIPDECDIAQYAMDCNSNGVPDTCDIGSNPSLDLNHNGVLDACENPGTPFCFGDATGAACPCDPGQSGTVGHGCRNSSGEGAMLSASGSASVTGDSLQLHVTDLPNPSSVIFFQGTAMQNGGLGALLGDGLLCANGSVIRLGLHPVQPGTSTFGFGVSGDPLVSVRGQVPVTGATRYYQAWYRDSTAFCTNATFNFSNAVAVTWLP